MKSACFCLLAVGLFLVAGCSSAESYVRAGYDFSTVDKVAVVDVVGDVGSNIARDQLADIFAMQLLKKGYAPVERAQVQNLLKEQEFQAGDLTAEEGVVQAGRILNVPAAALINVSVHGEEMTMTAKMLDVEDGSILWIGSGSGSTGKTLATIAGAAVGVAAGVAVGGEDNEVLGGIVGGVLGGVAGRGLSPQVAEKAKQVITKMCKDLPYSTK